MVRLQNYPKKVFYYLIKFEEILIVILLSAIMIIICVDVVMRFINFPLYGTSELVRYMFVWLVMFSAAVCIDRKKNFVIDFVIKRIKSDKQKKVLLLGEILIFIFLCIIIYKGIILSIKISGATSPALGIPQFYAYLGIPIGGFLMLLNLIFGFIQNKNIY